MRLSKQSSQTSPVRVDVKLDYCKSLLLLLPPPPPHEPLSSPRSRDVSLRATAPFCRLENQMPASALRCHSSSVIRPNSGQRPQLTLGHQSPGCDGPSSRQTANRADSAPADRQRRTQEAMKLYRHFISIPRRRQPICTVRNKMVYGKKIIDAIHQVSLHSWLSATIRYFNSRAADRNRQVYMAKKSNTFDIRSSSG
jgi:hypothetical protein